MTDHWAVKTLLDNGVAVAVLGAVLWALWQMIRWVGEVVVKPSVNAHILFLERAGQAIDLQTACLRKLGDQVDSLQQSGQRVWMDGHENRIGSLFRTHLLAHDAEIYQAVHDCPHGQDGCPLKALFEQIEKRKDRP